ncbi:MAG TPA: 5-(carboxyamino)imidazole ribonucleotide mutase [Myxococcota bacterium]|nr:5-(carboxyamino)imidazole ribonucleotide mutase [Myxococcota bacterium]HOA12494.1 5-(carboxyamino)imidazole ribonucleotide mutase [Myxococcota bacterium]HOH75799.1 5-(carboxyamino)imidazole ribonucleotide mutase [Myxococcota bacterium]HPV03448.1 5-(carboxyamino)imidazole ribonucleotide mutase [Myxococcota bacterium]
MEDVKVGVLVGSPSDKEIAEAIVKTLESLGIRGEIKVASAHRTPDLVSAYCAAAEGRGIQVLVACAGMAAHLAGAVAAQSLLPVIGVPVASGKLQGFDALLSTVQMPPGIPVATVAIDGAKNAAVLAARIIALREPAVRQALEAALLADRRKYTDQ